MFDYVAFTKKSPWFWFFLFVLRLKQQHGAIGSIVLIKRRHCEPRFSGCDNLLAIWEIIAGRWRSRLCVWHPCPASPPGTRQGRDDSDDSDVRMTTVAGRRNHSICERPQRCSRKCNHLVLFIFFASKFRNVNHFQLDSDNDISLFMPFLNIPMSFYDLLHRVSSVNNWF